MRNMMIVAVAMSAGCGGRAPASAPAPVENRAPPAPPAPAAPPGLHLTGIEPARGDADGGTYVKITGADFLGDGPRAARVYFGSRQGVVVRFAGDTELVVEAPAGKVGETVDVLVIFEPGGEVKLPQAFTFVERQPPP